MKEDEKQELYNEISELKQSLQSIQLATLNNQQEPEISYTPFIEIDTHFYIFVSELSAHTKNLFQHPTLQIFLIEDEQLAKNIFARRRISYKCESQTIKRDDPVWDDILDKFEQERGKTVSLLRKLSDFHLFQLRLIDGVFVKGFGQAFRLSGKSLSDISLINS